MKRILLMVFRNFFYVPYGWFRLNYYAKHVNKYTEEERYAMLQDIVKHANKGGRVTIEAHGIENIPKKNGFMFFPNHQGLYDVLAMADVCPKPFSVVAKQEVKNIQFLKQVFACMQAYFINRDDVRQAMEVITNVSNEVKAGRNYLIFPEGTRSKNGNQVGEFKGGSFKSATKARCPIVPVALIDSFKSFDTNSVKRLTVQVHFLKPLEFDEYKFLKTTEIASIVRGNIVDTVKKYEKM